MDINAILEKHLKWLIDEEGGERAYLSGADLSGAYLSGADLSGANLSRAYLYGANLSRAKNFKELEELFISYTSICPEGAIIGWIHICLLTLPYQEPPNREFVGSGFLWNPAEF